MIKDPKKISVIIPAYNVVEYIDECLDSIERQTYKDIEIIVIDDGSTDSTLDIVRKRAAISRTEYKIYTQKNSGQSSARNKGLREATGEYVIFVDSDDWLPDSEVIEKMFFAIYNSGCDYVQGGLSFIRNSKKTKEYFPNHIDPYIGDSILKGAILLDGLFTGPFAKIYNLTFLKSNSLFFFEGLVNEDTAHSIQIASYAKKVGFINECIYLVREREGSTSRADFTRMIRSMDEVMKICETDLIRRKKLLPVREIFYARYLRSILYNLLQSAQRSTITLFLADWKYCMENTEYLHYSKYAKYLSTAHRTLYYLSKHPQIFYNCFRVLNKFGIKMH